MVFLFNSLSSATYFRTPEYKTIPNQAPPHQSDVEDVALQRFQALFESVFDHQKAD